jgi:hypothetical protein
LAKISLPVQKNTDFRGGSFFQVPQTLSNSALSDYYAAEHPVGIGVAKTACANHTMQLQTAYVRGRRRKPGAWIGPAGSLTIV